MAFQYGGEVTVKVTVSFFNSDIVSHEWLKISLIKLNPPDELIQVYRHLSKSQRLSDLTPNPFPFREGVTAFPSPLGEGSQIITWGDLTLS